VFLRLLEELAASRMVPRSYNKMVRNSFIIVTTKELKEEVIIVLNEGECYRWYIRIYVVGWIYPS
jgi:hypothetical protein